MPRIAWIALAGCLFAFWIVIPALTPDHEIDVVGLATWGGVISIVVGLLGAVVWIAVSRGRPFGQRDVTLDIDSPYLRRGRLWRRWFATFFVFLGLIGSGFAVYWYPNPYPYLETSETPEEYALGVLAASWFFLVFGTAWLVLELYWSAVLRWAARQNGASNGTT